MPCFEFNCDQGGERGNSEELAPAWKVRRVSDHL